MLNYLLTEQPCLQEDCAEPGRNRKQEVLVRNRDGRQLGREKDQEDDDDLCCLPSAHTRTKFYTVTGQNARLEPGLTWDFSQDS